MKVRFAFIETEDLVPLLTEGGHKYAKFTRSAISRSSIPF